MSSLHDANSVTKLNKIRKLVFLMKSSATLIIQWDYLSVKALDVCNNPLEGNILYIQYTERAHCTVYSICTVKRIHSFKMKPEMVESYSIISLLCLGVGNAVKMDIAVSTGTSG